MNRCTTAFLYTSFKTAIGTGSALIGSSVLAAAGHVEYSEISVAAKAGSLGGATLGFIDYILQELIHHFIRSRDADSHDASLASAISFMISHMGTGILGLKFLSLAFDSISFTKLLPSIMLSTAVGSGVITGGAGVLLCAYLLNSRRAPRSIASATHDNGEVIRTRTHQPG